MTLVYATDADGPGVFLATKSGPKRVCFVPQGHRPTDEQMIRLETAWFTSARYPEPIPAERYLRAIGPRAQRLVPSFATRLPPDLALAETPQPKPWDAEP